MLATPATSVPAGAGWRHEVKWDGMRVIADVRDHRVRLTSRTERDVTAAFPELHDELARFADLMVDGEAVLLRDGVPDFAALGERMHVLQPERAAALAAAAPVALMLFDVLRVMGTDVAARPLRQRRAMLERVGFDGPAVHVPAAHDDGVALLRVTADRGLEGIVSKRIDSPYRAGRRSADWRKIVHRRRDSFVIGGWRPEVGSARLGAVLVGSPTGDGLAYRGRVGSGLAGEAGERLLARLSRLPRRASGFADQVPRQDAAGAHWVRPELVADIEFREVSTGGRLRQPAWIGLRGDLTPADLEAGNGR